MKFNKIIALVFTLLGAQNILTASNRITARKGVYRDQNGKSVAAANTSRASVKRKIGQNVTAQPLSEAARSSAKTSDSLSVQEAAKRVKLSPEPAQALSKTEAQQKSENAQQKEVASQNTALSSAAAFASASLSAAAAPAYAAPQTAEDRKALMIELFGEDSEDDSNEACDLTSVSASLQEASLRRKANLALATRKATASKLNGEILLASGAAPAVSGAATVAMRQAAHKKENFEQAYEKSYREIFGSSDSESSNSDVESSNDDDDDYSDNQPGKSNGRVICTTCHGTYKNLAILKSHQHRQHSGKDFRVDCPHQECRQRPLKKHLARHLKTHARTQDDRVTCSQCGVKVASEESLREHVKKHKKNLGKAFVCDVGICRDSFDTAISLGNHKMSHREATISCPLCELTFKRPVDLVFHSAHHKPQK